METGCRWNSVDECLPIKGKALDLSPNTERKKKKKQQQKCRPTKMSTDRYEPSTLAQL